MSKLSVRKIPSERQTDLSAFQDVEDFMERIRARAYELFRNRDGNDGSALDDWLEAERQISWPASELSESDDKYEIKVALAGFDKDEIGITATSNGVVVRAEHEASSKKDDDKSATCWSEFESNKVMREYVLREGIEVDKVSATYKDGMLKLRMPKTHEGKRRAKDVMISSAA